MEFECKSIRRNKGFDYISYNILHFLVNTRLYKSHFTIDVKHPNFSILNSICKLFLFVSIFILFNYFTTVLLNFLFCLYFYEKKFSKQITRISPFQKKTRARWCETKHICCAPLLFFVFQNLRVDLC